MALLVKISLLYILLRIFQPYHKRIVLVYALLCFIAFYYFIILFIKTFICHPISTYWEHTQNNDACFNRLGVIIADSIVSLITDLAILAFPIALTWSLNMPVSRKLRVICLLGIGGVASTFSLYRLVLVIQYRKTTNVTELFSKYS